MKIRLENLPALTKGKLLAITCERSGVKGTEVGRIELEGSQATLEIEDRNATRVIQALEGGEIDGRRIRARLLGEQSGLVQPLPPEEKPFERLRWLLDREREAEWARFEGELRTTTGPEREERGQALLDLSVKEQDGGLLGRTIVRFERKKGGLPRTRIGPGDVVRLSRRDPLDAENPSGVVLERTPTRVTVAFEDDLPGWAESGPLRLDRVGDDVTFKRTREALDHFETAKGHGESFREIVFGKRSPRFEKPRSPAAFLDEALNEAQRAAVTLALSAEDLALIHGPPGTGKTKTVVEVVRQALRRGERVLACAPSNHAVDNLVERLVAAGEPVVRVGHPARVSEQLRDHTLEALVEKTPSREIARRLWREAFALRTKLDRRRERGKETDREERREMGRLFQDARKQDEVALDHVLGGNAAVCATAAGAGGEHLRHRDFDVVILDEASQATLPLALVALARGKRRVLAGDHKQLPPTVLSPEAERGGLGATLFERLIERFPEAGTLLTVQYRMNERIMAFPSRELYQGKLVAHDSCARRIFADQDPFVFWDTSGMGHEEELAEGSTSARNPGEAAIVAARALALLALGLDPAELAVIAPYEAQVRLLRDLIPDARVEVDTVDGFQGREKEAVLVSLVRSNAEGSVGFLSDVRRMNVALTRARSRLEVVGDASTVSSHPFYARFVEHAQKVDAWHSGYEVV